MCAANIVALTGICLIIMRCVWICVDNKDRGGRYGR